MLLIYTSLGPIFQAFATEDTDFTTAMYGELTTRIDKRTSAVSELFNGKNRSLQENKNTSFNAVGRLADRGDVRARECPRLSSHGRMASANAHCRNGSRVAGSETQRHEPI